MSIGTNTPFGFQPVRIVGTGNSTFSTEQFDINPTNGTPIGVGDLVTFDGSGYVRVATTSDAIILGVFQGVTYEGNNQPVLLDNNSNYWSGAARGQTIINANVLVSKTILFQAQLSNAGVTRATFAAPYCTFIGAAPTASSGSSNMVVDSGSFSSTPGTLPLKFVGLAPTPSGATQNAYGVQYNIGLFILNTAYFGI